VGDITQEAFARFVQFRGLEKVADDSSAVAYLLRTCRNVFLDGVKQDRRITTDTSVDLETIESDPTTPDPLVVIDRLAKKLDADDQRFFKMTRDGRTLAEIATTLGISYTAAGVRLHRIKKRLRDLFG
jgi:RNA polymerase sigma factor (sigma-70 family)